jgi:hypothetical protein
LAAAVSAFYLVTGTWALMAPTAFYRAVAPFPPGNDHFLRDGGAFAVGLGLVAAIAAKHPAVTRSIMAAVAVASALHLLSHVFDVHEGGHPTRDLVVLPLVVLAAGVASWKANGRAVSASGQLP